MGNKNTSMSSVEGDMCESLLLNEDITNQNNEEKVDDSRNLKVEQIMKRQCIKFSKRQERGGADHGDPLCHCNYRKSQHPSNVDENNKDVNDSVDTGDTINGPAWDYKKNTTKLPTDAFGKMSFDTHSKDKYSEYVRVAEDTEPEDIWTLLTENWCLDPPNLLISIAGGTMSDVEQKLRVVCQRAIVETASTTKAWIFTDGINAGVSKLVGEAVEKFRDNGNQLSLIGIAPWGWVRNKKVLEQTSKDAVPYTFNQTSFEDSGPLDCNHTHFLLVDNGTQNQVGVEVQFRERLEQFVSESDASKIDVLSDTRLQLKRKIEEGKVENNKVLEFVKHSVFPYLPEKCDGTFMECDKYEDVKRKYENKDIQVKDLKGSIVKYLDGINEGTNANQQHEEEGGQKINPVCDSIVRISEKIKGIDCGDDQLLTFTEHVIFPHLGGKDLVIHRNEQATVNCRTYEDLKCKIENRELLTADLRQGILAILEKLPPKDTCTVIPSVLIVISGGPETLKTVLNAVENGKPVIIFKGTSGAADILACACTKDINSDELKTKLALCGWNPDVHITDLMKCAKKKERLTVFNLESPDFLNMAILNAVKSITVSENKVTNIDKYILQLALVWNNVELISKEIVINYKTMQTEYLEELMLRAMKEDKVDFVKHFLSNGVQSEEFCNERRINILYKEAPEELQLRKMILDPTVHGQEDQVSKKDDKLSYKDIADFIGKVIGTPDDSQVKKDDQTQQAAHKLFIWSLLMFRADLAKLFFQKCKNAMATSLIAVILLNHMDGQTQDNALKVKIEKIKKYYLSISGELLNDCYAQNKDNTHLLLVKELSYLGKIKSCIGLAFKADNKEFIGHAACQSLFDNIWNGQKTKNNGSTNQLPQGLMSPFAKFVVNYVLYFLFLVLYSLVLLTRFHPMPNMHPLEIALVVWIATFFCEELRQLLEYGEYINDPWNKLDVATLLLYLPGFVLRLIPEQNCPGCFEAAVITLAISLMVFTLRILHMFAAVKTLGPKLVMIQRMMKDLLQFIAILMVFITAYGVALQVVLYPNAQLDKYLFLNIFRKAYWQIYGELFLEDLEGDVPDCSNDAMVYNNYTLGIPRCPENTWFGPVLLAFYILITNVLMLNLLIAMFSFTFTNIHEKSDKIWKYNRYALIREFASKPPVPPPFSLPYNVYLMIKRCRTGDTNYQTQNPFKSKNESEKLVKWEIDTSAAYFTTIESTEQVSTDRIPSLIRHIEYVEITLQKLKDKQDMMGQMDTTKQPIETVPLSQCAVDTVSWVDDNHDMELEECTYSGIPHDISEYSGSVTYNYDNICIVSGGFYPPRFTIVNLLKQTNSVNTYTIPEGIGTLSGVMIRKQVINGRKRELYMFVVMYEDGCYRVCTISIDSNTLSIKARFMIGYDPIQAFRIDKLNRLGVLCTGDINRILVFSQDRLEYPSDIYRETLHHNTVQGCDDVISLTGSEGVATSICVTCQGQFCAGMWGESQVQIFNPDGTYLTTIGKSREQAAPISAGDVFQPCSIICTLDDHILVVGMQGDVQLFKPEWGRILKGGHHDENAWKIVRNKKEESISGPDLTLYSTICKGFMVNVEQIHNHRKVRVYPLQTTEPARPSVNRESYAQTQLQLIKHTQLY